MLTISKLIFERNNLPLFSEINCVLHPGQLLQITGANGSGKSTLLRIIAGYIEPHEGSVLWEGEKKLHYLGHANGIKPQLTVYENLRLFCALKAKKIASADIKAIAQTLGLTQLLNTQALYLSAGQSRRLALSRLLLTPAPLWLLDEPTTALDAEGQALLTHLLNQHVTSQGIAVIATHQLLPITCVSSTIHIQASQARGRS